MNVTHKFTLDLTAPGNPQQLHVMQNDKYSRCLAISLFAGGIPWEPPAGSHALIRYSRNDGTTGEYNILPNGTQAWAIEANTLNVVLAPEVTAGKGVVSLSATLLCGTQEITTFVVMIYVRSHPNWNGSSMDYYGISETDTTLTLSGRAADARVTGTMLSQTKERLDQLTALPDGSTAGNAELTDIRVGYDGASYSSAGEAIRSQVEDLYKELAHLADKALISAEETPYLLSGSVINHINPLNRWFFPVTLRDVRLKSIQLYLNPTTVESQITVEVWNKSGNDLTLRATAICTIGADEDAGYREFTLDEIISAEAMVSVKAAHYSVAAIADGSTMLKNSDLTGTALSCDDFVEFTSGGFLGSIVVYSDTDRATAKPKMLRTVGTNMQYATIQEAVDASDSGDTILIYPGTYREQVNALGKRIHIVGLNKHTCILIDSSANYYTPPLWMNIGSIENMTVIEDAADPDPNTPEGYLNCAYCIHADSSETAIGQDLRISNCILRNANRACIGIGTFQNYSIIVENCDIFSGAHDADAPERGAVYFHNCIDSADDQYISLRHNRIECGGNKALYILGTGPESGSFVMEFINNTCFCAGNGAGNDAVYMGADSTMTIHAASNGNNIPCLNYN